MNYTAIQSEILAALNGAGEIFLIAAIGVCTVFAAQIIRLYLARFRAYRRFNSYRYKVVAPFVADQNLRHDEAMTPYFARRKP